MTSNAKKIILISGLAATIAGCSTYHPMESVDAKMGRYHSKHSVENEVPNMYVMNKKFVRASRGPASASVDYRPATNYNNKRLYFQTLYSQYEKMQKYSKTSVPKIQSCPNFHTAFIGHSERFTTPVSKSDIVVRFTQDQSKWSRQYRAYYPEMNLPISLDGLRPTVADTLKMDKKTKAKKIIAKAMDVHLIKTYRELKQLCVSGSSDNYYAFENLVTHVHKAPFPPTSDNMRILLKTTLFTNMSLLNSFEGKAPKRGIASATEFESLNQDLMHRLKAPWAKDYFKEVINSRK